MRFLDPFFLESRKGLPPRIAVDSINSELSLKMIIDRIAIYKSIVGIWILGRMSSLLNVLPLDV